MKSAVVFAFLLAVALGDATFLRGGVFKDQSHWRRRFGDDSFVPQLGHRLSKALMGTSSGKPPLSKVGS